VCLEAPGTIPTMGMRKSAAKLAASQRSKSLQVVIAGRQAPSQHLVRRCAEPRPVGDSVKQAVIRASQRLGFKTSRTKNIWYSEARQIGAREMDRLRNCASGVEIDKAVVDLVVLRSRLSGISSPAAREAVDGIDTALRVLGVDEHVGVIDVEAL